MSRAANDQPDLAARPGAPRLSVLVPTRGRPALAADCARSILAQDHPSFELLVLDQTEGSAGAAAMAAVEDRQRRLRHVPLTSVGRSRALNAGLRLARGEVWVMTDDDCEPTPGWLRALDAEVRAAGPRAAIVGRVLPGPAGPGMAVPPATLDEPEPADYAGRVDRDLVYPNFAVPRHAFDEVGPFDERLGIGTSIPGGEDNDFGYRLLRHGWRILYRPGPVVVHLAWRTAAERLALKRAYGIGQGGFYAKHLARADAWIAWRCAKDLARTARAAAGAALRGHGADARGHVLFFEGMLAGMGRMAGALTSGVPEVGDARADSGSTGSPSRPGGRG